MTIENKLFNLINNIKNKNDNLKISVDKKCFCNDKKTSFTYEEIFALDFIKNDESYYDANLSIVLDYEKRTLKICELSEIASIITSDENCLSFISFFEEKSEYLQEYTFDDIDNFIINFNRAYKIVYNQLKVFDYFCYLLEQSHNLKVNPIVKETFY